MTQENGMPQMHSTTIVCVKKGKDVVMVADGQVSLGDMVAKGNAHKLRRIPKYNVLLGFAGDVADCLTLADKLEGKLKQYSGQLLRSVIELSRDWRSDKYLKHLHASVIVADKDDIFVLGGKGDVLQVETGVASVGSGSKYAIAAAMALVDIDGTTADSVATKAINIAGELCIYTNKNITKEIL